MDKQKEIEKMAQDLAEAEDKFVYDFCEDVEKSKDCKCNTVPCQKLINGIAENLYNAGYRLADEVRKETAREILQDVDNLVEIMSVIAKM